MALFQDPAAWLTIASLIIALIALHQTQRQIKLSNKQQLFDRRLEKYLLLEELLRCYREERRTIEHVRSCNTQTDEMLCIQFISFTSTHSLGEISKCIYEKSEHNRNLFLSKLDMLDMLEQEISFLFPQKEANLANEFIHVYTELLITLYAYRNDIELVPIPSDDTERNWTILTLYYALQESCDAIENNKVESKMAKIIHL